MGKARFLLFCVFIFVQATFAQGPARTTIQDTIYGNDGGLANGTIQITNPNTFTSADGFVVAQTTLALTQITNGVLNVTLVPNVGSSPLGTYYIATYVLTTGSFTETWIVPSSGTPVALLSVRAAVPPQLGLLASFNQLAPPPNCTNKLPLWTGSSWTCTTGGGGSSTFQVNGTNTSSQTTINFQSSSAFNGLTATFSNPSTGNVQLGFSGTLGDAGLTSAYSGVGSCAANQFANALSRNAAPGCAQVGYGQLSGVPSTFAPAAHNLLSSAHGDTATHTVVRGDLIAGIGASPAWTAVAKGSTNTYPKWNASGDVVPSTNPASGAGSCPANQYETADNADAAPTCAQVAYSQVSGTPTLFYQTVQNASGSAQTQRPTVEFTGTAVASVTDDSSNNRTVVTLTASAGSGITLQTGGTNNVSQTALNFQAGGAVNGLTITPSNPSGGNEQMALSGILTVPGGGTGLGTLSAHQLYVGNGTATPNPVAAGNSGQVLISNGGSADPTFQDPVISYNNPAESTAAWTSATAQNTVLSVNLQVGSGVLDMVTVTFNQTSTITGGVVTFYASDTTGLTNIYPISCWPQNGTSAVNTYTLQQSTNQAFQCNVSGFEGFQVKLTTAITGTGTANVGIQSTSAPSHPQVAITNFPATQPVSGTVAVSNFPGTQPVSGTVTANQGGTWTMQPGNTANTTPWLMTINQGGNSVTVTGSNALKVDGSAVTQPVSGTVTANIGTTNGLALDTSVNGLLLSQGSTTSGQKAPLVQGAVTTSAPAYTTAQTSPLSLDTSGNLRTSVNNTVTIAALPTGANTIGKVDVLGNAGASLDSAAGASPGTAATNQLQVGGQFQTSPPTLTNGQGQALQMDNKGNLLVNLNANSFGTFTVNNTQQGTASENLAQVNGSTVSTAATGVQKVGITGNAGAAMDAAGQNAASPANSLLAAAQFNTTPATLTSGNMSPLQMDSAGNLLVNVKAGGGSGGTSSSFAAAFPATGTAIGVKNGTNMTNLTADGSNNLNVNCAVGCSASSNTVTLFSAQAATGTATSSAVSNPLFGTFGTLNITGASITGSPSGCSMALASQPATGSPNSSAYSTTAFTPASSNQTFQIGSQSITAADKIVATYSCTVYPSGGTISVTFSPIETVALTNIGNAPFAQGQRTMANSISIVPASDFSASDTIGAGGTLNALNATASVALNAQQGAGVMIASGTVSETLTPEVSMDGGTTWSATEFLDPTTGLPAATLVLSNPGSNIQKTILIPAGSSNARARVSAYTSGSVTATVRATTVKADVLWPSLNSNGQVVVAPTSSGATGSAVPASAQYSGGDGSGNTTGYLNCDNAFTYDNTTNGATQLGALTSSKKWYVCGFQFSTSQTTLVHVALEYGTGTNCATGPTKITPNYPLQSASSTGPIGLVVMTPGFTGLQTIASNALCIVTDAAVSVQGIVWATQF